MGVTALPTSHARSAHSAEDRLRLWLSRLLIVASILLVAGLAAVFSTTVFLRIAQERPPFTDFFQQLCFAAIGIALAWLTVQTVGRFSPARRWLRYLIPGAFLASLVLVAMVKFTPFGVSVMGATRSLDFGFIKFQPSELLKISLVLYLAQVLCWHRLMPEQAPPAEQTGPLTADEKLRSFRQRAPIFQLTRDARPVWPELPKRCLLAVLMAIGLTVIQPDLGTTSIIFGSGIITMLLAGVDWRQLALFICGLALLLGLAVLVAPSHFDYAKERVHTWLHPYENTDSDAYQITQSRGAIAAGGFWGAGYLKSDQKMNRLPLSTKDFVYPVMVEELGYVGGMLIIMMFLYLAWVGKNLAMGCRDPFARTVIAALGFTICLQAFVNIGTTMGTLPLTGITLPFFSDGGTSLVVTMIALGFMYALARNELVALVREAARREA